MKIISEGYVRLIGMDIPDIDEMGRLIVRTDDTKMPIPDPGLHVFIVDADELVDEVFRLGTKYPLSKSESKRLMTKVIETMRSSAEKRGDTETLEQLQGASEVIAERIVSEPRTGIPKQTKIWTTSGKKKIRVCDMDDNHLKNAIRYVRQYAESHRLNHAEFASTLSGDIASSLAEEEQVRLAELHVDDLAIEVSPIHENLLLEAERRGLEIKEG